MLRILLRGLYLLPCGKCATFEAVVPPNLRNVSDESEWGKFLFGEFIAQPARQRFLHNLPANAFCIICPPTLSA
jgi:hypothetical protein